MPPFNRALLLVLVAGCGPGVAPPSSDDGSSTGMATTGDASTTALPTAESSTGGLYDSSSSGSSGSGSSSSGSGGEPVPIEWCLSEHVLDSYWSNSVVRLVQLEARAPHVVWRHPTSSSRHWASRIDVFGESEEVVFDIERPTLGFLQFGDIDGDGRTDAIDHNNGSGSQWFRGDPELGLALDPEPMVLPVGYGLRIIADFDGDGLVDVAVGNNYYTDLVTAFGDGTGVFTEADSFNFDPRGGYQPAELHSLQGGWEWFMVQHLLCDACSGRGIALGLIGADGSIGEHQRIEGITVNRLLGSDDHDGDGVLDLLVTVFDPELERTDLVWLDSSPEGQYEMTTVSTEISPYAVELDVDGDHFNELFIKSMKDGPALRRWTGTELGPLELVLDVDLAATSLHVDMGHGDVDGDGWTDFVGWVLDQGNVGIVISHKVWTLRPCDGA